MKEFILHNIIEFYKKSDKKLIGYFQGDFDLTCNIIHAKRFKPDTNLEPVAHNLLERTYKEWDPIYQSMSKHTYGHLYEDWFRDIEIEDIGYRIINFENELRRLKMEDIQKKKS